MGANSNLLFFVPVSQVSVGSKNASDLLRSHQASFTSSRDYSLSPTRFVLAYLMLPVTHITLVLHREGGLGKNPQVLEVSKLSVQFQPRSFAPSALSELCTPFLPPGHTVPNSPSALPCRINLGRAAKVKFLAKLLPEKVKQGLKDAFMFNPMPTLECKLLFFREQLAPPDLFLQQRLCAVQGQVHSVFMSSH